MAMEEQPHLSHILSDRPGALQGRWSASVRGLSDRLASLFSRPNVFTEVRGLLLDLVALVERTGSVEQAVDAEFSPILDHLKALQTEYRFSSTEMVFLLFSMKDAIKNVVREVVDQGPQGQHKISENFHVVNQVSMLLNRLGLVFFETSMRSRDDENAPQDVLAIEYALLYERTRQMAITDLLTGLHNFGYFRDRLKEERARADRYQRLLSLIILDLDHFKIYNDANGHPAGNDVLRRTAAILKEETRETDLTARYGGEEMVILLPEANRKTAWELAERIRRRMEAEKFADMKSQPLGRVTLSAGVATYPVDAANEDELVARADASLYKAKNGGRNRVEAWDPPDKVLLRIKPEPWVTQVALVGSFNNWDKDADPMERDPDGSYRFVISLNPGVYEYKFVLNGAVWISDPSASEGKSDNLGGHNSLLKIEKTVEPVVPKT